MLDLTDHVADLETQAEFRGVVRDFVRKAAPLAATRRYVDGAREYDATVWQRAVKELQAVDVGLPESVGGQGAGLTITGVLFEEFGRALVPCPLLGTVALAATLLSRLGSAEAAADLRTLAQGGGTATVGWVGESASWDPAQTPLRASGIGLDVTVSGTLHHVIDGDVADTLYLVVRHAQASSSALTLVAVSSGAPGLTTRRLESLDLTRRLARVELDDTPARVVAGPDAAPAIAKALLVATALLSVESAGAARAVMEQAIEYANLRHQFGRPIGSFQAIKHKCADMLLKVELATAIAQEALRELDLDDPHAAALVHSAKAYTSQAFFEVASEAVQVHGGIGFTWEHDAHLFFRRAKASDALFGNAVHHRAAVAAEEGWIA
jgi:alkylation response protein AidB-like acyl-CoA dehydrogenase